jgi:cytochrome P450
MILVQCGTQLILTSALRDYEPRVIKYTDQLLEKLETSRNESFDVALWFNFYSFDVMGDLAFGKSFDMLKNGVKHYFMEALHLDMMGIRVLTHVIWFVSIFLETPILNYHHKKFWAWVAQTTHERIAVCTNVPHFMVVRLLG